MMMMTLFFWEYSPPPPGKKHVLVKERIVKFLKQKAGINLTLLSTLLKFDVTD